MSKITTVGNITAEIGITKEDLIAIKVAKVESDLMIRQSEVEKMMKDLRDKTVEAIKARDEAATAWIKSEFDFTEMEKPFLKIGLKIKIEFTLSFDPKPKVTFLIKDSFRGISSECNLKCKDVDKAVEKIDALVKEMEKCQNQLCEIRRDLSRIGTVERQVRGALAFAVYKGTEAGDALMEAMDNIAGFPKIG